MTRRELAALAVKGVVGAVVFLGSVWVLGAVAVAVGIEPGVIEP